MFTGALSRDLLFAAVFLLGSARAFEMPTIHALVPAMVPGSMLARAVAAWTSANQVAVICGPALGGLLYVASPVLVSVICLVFFSAAIALVSLARPKGAPEQSRAADAVLGAWPALNSSAAIAACSG